MTTIKARIISVMKTLKFLGSTTLLCLMVVACAKSNNEEPARLADTQKTSTDSRAGGEKAKFDIEKEGTYTGPSVTLTKNAEGKTDNKGQIVIGSDDAKELYERMKVKAVSPNTATELNVQHVTKKGKNLECSQFTRGADSKFSCVVYIDYRTGKLSYGDQAVVMDDQAKVETKAFSTDTLSILEGEAGIAIMSVKGDDAKALYDTLSGKETPMLGDTNLSSKTKSGENVRCYENTVGKKDAVPTYTCSLSIVTADGTVKVSEATPATQPAETQPVTDGAAPEAPAATDAPAASETPKAESSEKALVI